MLYLILSGKWDPGEWLWYPIMHRMHNAFQSKLIAKQWASTSPDTKAKKSHLPKKSYL